MTDKFSSFTFLVRPVINSSEISTPVKLKPFLASDTVSLPVYIDYTKIPSLQYYLIIEPETTLINCYKKSENGEWFTSKYTRPEDVIKLDVLKISFQVKGVYS